MIKPLTLKGDIGHKTETLLARTSRPETADQYRSELQSRDLSPRLVTLRALTGMAATFPRVTANLFDRHLPDDMSFIGAGSRMVAYKTGSKVVKVYTRSVALSPAERQDFAVHEQREHEVLRRYLGDAVVPSQVVVAPHPLSTASEAVQIHQEYIPYVSLNDVFPQRQPVIDKNAVQSVLAEFPNVDEQLYDIANQGLKLSADTGLIPDVAGAGNIGVVSNGIESQIVLVDSQPEQTTHPWAADYLLPQLEDMRSFLDPVHPG